MLGGLILVKLRHISPLCFGLKLRNLLLRKHYIPTDDRNSDFVEKKMYLKNNYNIDKPFTLLLKERKNKIKDKYSDLY